MIGIESLQVLSANQCCLNNTNVKIKTNNDPVVNLYLTYKMIYIYALFRFIQCYRYIPKQHVEKLFPRLQPFNDFAQQHENSPNHLIYSRFNFIYNYYDFFNTVAQYHNHFTVNYAVKCLADRELLNLLAQTGGCFDCASVGEIDSVIDLTSPENIIYANCCKTKRAIEHSRKRKIKLTTFDNYDELQKIQQYNPDTELLLRIEVDSYAKISLSNKFGMDLDDIEPLLKSNNEQLKKIVGISFHVGSDNNKPLPWLLALKKVFNVINLFERYGYTLKIIDLGGGYNNATFKNVIHNIFEVFGEQLLKYRLIFEPGRCLVENVVSYLPIYEIHNQQLRLDNPVLYSYFRDSVLVKRVFPFFYGNNVSTVCDSENEKIHTKKIHTVFPQHVLLFPNFGAYTVSIACERLIHTNKIYI